MIGWFCAAPSSAACQSVVFPIPASPTIARQAGLCGGSETNALMTSKSASRPTTRAVDATRVPKDSTIGDESLGRTDSLDNPIRGETAALMKFLHDASRSPVAYL